MIGSLVKKANKIVMAIAGVVLIIASILKAHQLLTEPIISMGFWESWLFFVIQIPLEMGLGIWLLCGLFRKAAWLIAVVSFGFLILVTDTATIDSPFSGVVSYTIYFDVIYMEARIAYGLHYFHLFLMRSFQ